jgi:hypothetical protein
MGYQPAEDRDSTNPPMPPFFSPIKSNTMKNFLINLAITILSLYTIVAFISFMPNPATWDCGGRGAFAIFSLIITAVATAIQDSCKS